MGAKGCPIEKAVSILEGKWTLLILRELFTGMKRFGELRSELDGISPKTLTERLRILEAQGIVQRTIYPEVPPRVEYALTEYGETLRPVIDALRAWANKFLRLFSRLPQREFYLFLL